MRAVVELADGSTVEHRRASSVLVDEDDDTLSVRTVDGLLAVYEAEEWVGVTTTGIPGLPGD